MLDNEIKFNNKTVEIITGTNPDASIVDSRITFYYAVYKACTGSDYTGDNAEVDALNELIKLYTGNEGSGSVIDDWITFCINAITAYDETVRSYSLVDLKYQLFELFKDIGLQLVPDYTDLQQWLEGYSGPTIEDYIGTLDAKLVYNCPKILNDNPALTLDADPTATITEVNGSSTTTGVSISGAVISFDFSELPEERIWQVKLSNGSEYHLLGSTRVFDISGNGNHATLSGTLDADYEIAQQSEFDPYASYGFNKYFRNLTGSEITLTLNSVDYDVAANGYLICPDALLEIQGTLADMTGDTTDAEIIDIPEDRSNAGYDVLGAEIVYTQDGNTILNAEGCQIDFDTDDSEDAILDIFDRDNDTFHDLDISQNGDYDSAYPYRWSVWELFNNNDFVTYNREYKLRAFNQTVENGFPIGIRRIVNYDDQRLDGIDADTTTINRLSNCLNTLSIADQATMYDSKLYIDKAVRPSLLDASGLMADMGDGVGEVINLSGNVAVTQADPTKQPILTVDGLLFDGVDDCYNLGDNSAFELQNFEITIEDFQFHRAGEYEGIIALQCDASTADGLSGVFIRKNIDNRILFYFPANDIGQSNISESVLSINTKYELKFVKTGAKSQIYINGILNKEIDVDQQVDYTTAGSKLTSIASYNNGAGVLITFGNISFKTIIIKDLS